MTAAGRRLNPAIEVLVAAEPAEAGLKTAAYLISGSFDISSPPGAGTRVRIRLPLPATPAPHGPIRPAPPAPPT